MTVCLTAENIHACKPFCFRYGIRGSCKNSKQCMDAVEYGESVLLYSIVFMSVHALPALLLMKCCIVEVRRRRESMIPYR